MGRGACALGGIGAEMARWARLELATDDLENRCSVQLSYHRVNAPKYRSRLDLGVDLDKLKPALAEGYAV